ncbi:hypothetical protein GALMADRAFT_1365568 [Galerina marginata CBS 339.88]|uniref:G-protein coupled receptors family 1 profile domain-containing protein n=1 Tax=Galerina marginata (strain CBS 339.88) TaxID=685588 RepID=A0A067T6Z4_GALM3|nr:hypothetical protein GALMADRAFT_1365568 [Galerina marginata CBS 339.88]
MSRAMSELAFSPIPSSQIGGAITVNVFSLLSTIALVSVIIRVTWLGIQRCRKSQIEVRECVFFNTQLGRYAACLIIAMVFNAIAGILGLRWVVNNGITEGWVCRTQATIMQVGNFATGYFTTAIAVHTFNSLVLKMKQSVIICRTTITVGWVSSFLIALIPFMLHMPEGHVYGANGLSCSVRQTFPKLQFVFHLLPILLASFFGAILYSLIFLALRGTLKFKSGIKITLNPHERWHDSEGLGENYHRFIARVARSMLWYPVAYVAFLIPYAVTRLFMISGFLVPFEAVVFAYVCYFSLSFVDVLVLYNTFRVLGPAFDARSAASTRRLESFGTTGNLEKYAFSPVTGSPADMAEKIEHYRTQSLGSPRPSINSFSTSSGRSTQQLLPLYLGRGAAEYRNSGQSNPSMIGRSITPSSTYSQWEIATPPQAVAPITRSPTRNIATHIRNDSLSSRGLPAPPRRTRSPTMTQPMPEIQLSNQFGDEYGAEQWMSRQRSTQTFGHPDSPQAKSPSLFSEEATGSEWSSRIHRDSPPHSYGQPLLSAVVSSFPAHVHPRSPPQSATHHRSNSAYSSSPSPISPLSDRHRPSHLARGSSPDLRSQRNMSSRNS